MLLTTDVTPSSPPKSLAHKAWVYNDGSGDIGDTPTQFLLVRNLDTMLREETIATGMAKLEVIPKRVLLIKDRKTKVSWGFGFVEYQDVHVSSLTFNVDISTLKTHSMLIRVTKPSKSRNPRSRSHFVILVSLSLSTQSRKITLSQPEAVLRLLTGTSMDMHQNGFSQRKKVYLSVTTLKSAAKDAEVMKFYNDLKAAEVLHATAASIIQGEYNSQGPISSCRTSYACLEV